MWCDMLKNHNADFRRKQEKHKHSHTVFVEAFSKKLANQLAHKYPRASESWKSISNLGWKTSIAL